MFQFSIVISDKDPEYHQPRLEVKTTDIALCFEPRNHCITIDPNANSGKILFYLSSDGEVSISWDEKSVCILLASDDDDKGKLSCQILKTDDSLATALTKWQEFSKYEKEFQHKLATFPQIIYPECDETCKKKKKISCGRTRKE